MFRKMPPESCYLSAKGNRAVRYERVSQKPDHVKAVLQQGYPVVFGFLVHESFESERVKEKKKKTKFVVVARCKKKKFFNRGNPKKKKPNK